jgi:hypothetical protein
MWTPSGVSRANGSRERISAPTKRGVKQIDERIWLVSFMQYDAGFSDDETCRLEPADNPFHALTGPEVMRDY